MERNKSKKGRKEERWGKGEKCRKMGKQTSEKGGKAENEERKKERKEKKKNGIKVVRQSKEYKWEGRKRNTGERERKMGMEGYDKRRGSKKVGRERKD